MSFRVVVPILILSTVLIGAALLMFREKSSGRVLSATSQSASQSALIHTSFIKGEGSCDFYIASWVQHKRDFMEESLRNYPSTASAIAALETDLQSFKQQAHSRHCDQYLSI